MSAPKETFIDNKKLVKSFCSNLDENYLRIDVELMLAHAGIEFTKDAPKSELCKLLTKNLPSRVLEAILIYGSQVGKGAAVSIVLALLISSIFAPGILAPLAVETVTGVPMLYGAVTGIYDGTRTMLKMDQRAYKNVARKDKMPWNR
jgi:hypothetical protein